MPIVAVGLSLGGVDQIAMRLSPGSFQVGRRWSHLLMWALMICLSLAPTGCYSLTAKREQQDIVESDLRSQERHIQELKAEVERRDGTIHGLDLEVERLQQSAAGIKPTGEPPVPGVVKEIVLGTLTGGYRANPKSTYDDALQFLISPRDADGHAIKAPGSLHIELFEVLPSGMKNPLSAWDITQRELRRSWDQPLFGGPAYRILIPFKALPANEKMRVVIRFTTLDGKPYEAEKEFTIRLPGLGSMPVMPSAPMPGGYSVVTPGRMINGTLVGPMSSPEQPMPQNNATMTPPAPPVQELPKQPKPAEITKPMPEPAKKQEPPKQQDSIPPPPVPILEPTKPSEKKSETIPIIPFNPKPTPATLESTGREPPPLGPPPQVPELEKHSKQYEKLPSPSAIARSNQPLVPVEAVVTQAGYEAPAPGGLTAAPSAAWRQKYAPVMPVEATSEAPIKLSRPVVVK